MHVIEKRVLPPDEAEQAADLYTQRFAPVSLRAAQHHQMDRGEVAKEFADERKFKFLARDDAGCLVGLSTLTNDLTSLAGWISPRFFARNWPVCYKQHRIWYVGFACAIRGGGEHEAFEALLLAMNERRDSNNGISFQDYCKRNEPLAALTLGIYAKNGIYMDDEVVDVQSYHLLKPVGVVAE